MSGTHRIIIAHLGAAVFFALAMSSHTSAGTITVALTGDTAAGTSGGVFSNFTLGPRLNDSGQIVVHATLTGGDVSGATNNTAHYSGTAGNLSIAVRKGDVAPGTLSTFNNISLSTFFIDQNGDVGFDATLLQTGGVTAADDRGFWISSGGVVADVIVREGVTNANLGGPTGPGVTASATFTGSNFINGTFNNGTIAFRDVLVNNGTNTEGAWTGDTGGLTQVAFQRTGVNAPGTSVKFGQMQSNMVVNSNGEVAFLNALNGGPRAIYSGAAGNPGALSLVALGGAAAGDLTGGETYGASFSATSIGINDAQQVVFWNSLTLGGSVTSANDGALFAGAAGDVKLVAREGDAAPGTAETFRLPSTGAVINAQGHVAFTAGFTSTGNDDDGIWAGPAGGINLIVRTGDAAVDADGNTIAGITHTAAFGASPAMIEGGQVVFANTLDGTGITTANDRGVWIADQAGDARLVVREGDALAGSTVADGGISLVLGSGGEDGRRTTANIYGQVAYNATLTDGNVGVFLYTPELHWRRTNPTGAWDAADNWTLTLDPGNPHDVFIDPDVDVKVSGPAGAVTVTTLTIGGPGSAGQAELNLTAGGNLTVTDGVSIAANGTLSGNGAITGDVTASGAIAPGNSPGLIVIDGGLTLDSNATLVIEAFGPAAGIGYDQLVVSGAIDLGGALFVLAAGQNVNFGDVLTIIDNTGGGSITGQFLGLGQGAIITLSGSPFATISYTGGDGNDVTLNIIPEPAAAVMLGLGAWVMGVRRRGRPGA